MVNPIVQFDASNFVVWGQKKAHNPLPLPMNPWLRRRRLGGVKYEVERLYTRFAELHLSQEDAEKQILTFVSSEYKKNAVYYRFINLRIGIRRMALAILTRLGDERKNSGQPGS